MNIPNNIVISFLLLIWAAMLVFNSRFLAIIFLLFTTLAYGLVNLDSFKKKGRK